MSKYVTLTVDLKDQDALVAALQAVGFSPVEVAPAGQKLPLYTYTGTAWERQAEVVVRRQHLSSVSNDLGFERVGESFRIHVSDMDVGRLRSTLNRLKVEYADHTVRRLARQRGWRIVQEEEPPQRQRVLTCVRLGAQRGRDRQPPQVIVTIHPEGEVTLEGEGFPGHQCDGALLPFEVALGTVLTSQRKAREERSLAVRAQARQTASRRRR